MTSRWRELAFMLRQVRGAIMPQLSLRDTFDQWSDICHQLAEPPRKRKLQEQTLTLTS